MVTQSTSPVAPSTPALTGDVPPRRLVLLGCSAGLATELQRHLAALPGLCCRRVEPAAVSARAAADAPELVLLETTTDGGSPTELAHLHARGGRRFGVVLLAPRESRDAQTALQEGWADELLSLPPMPAEVLARVRTQLELARVRRDAAARVRESEDRFRHVADHSPFIFWVTDPEGHCIYLNERWYEFTGQGRQDGWGQGWLEAVHPEDVAATAHAFQRAQQRRISFTTEYRLRRHDGSYRWVVDSGAPRWREGTFAGFVGSVIDVTDRREEYAALDRSRSQMQLALKAARSGTFDWDIPTGRITWSPELEELYGLAPGSFAGTFRAWSERVLPSDAEAVERLLQGCFEQRLEFADYEFRVRLPDGTLRWFEGKARFDYTTTGKPRRMTGINVDIDARKRAERNAHFLDEVTQAIALLKDPDEIMRRVTAAVGLHLGVQHCRLSLHPTDPASAVAQDWSDASPVADWPAPPDLAAASGLLSCENSGTRSCADVHELSASPAHRAAWAAAGVRAFASATLVRERPECVHFLVTDNRPRTWQADELELLSNLLARAWPLVERARSEQAIDRAEAKTRESAERLRITMQAAQLGTWDFDPRSRVLVWDARCRELFGVAPDEPITGELFMERLHPDDRARAAAAVERALAPGSDGAYDVEVRSAAPGSPARWLRATGKALFDPQGNAERFIGTVADVTELVKARETLAESRNELERLVDERTARLQDTIAELEGFSYSISHDLRAPLRAMQSFAQLLSDEYRDRLDADGRDYLRRIIGASERMDRLIHDVLVYSRVARTELELEPVDLEQLIDGILESYPQFKPGAASIEMTRPLPEVLGNEAALTQCLSNLLGNAVKFVPLGVHPRVCVWAERTPGRVRLYVRDNGIGIAREAHEKIFGIFERLSRSYEGTGIGLAVVRKAAERMGGSVTVQSEPGSGSTFCLELAAS